MKQLSPQELATTVAKQSHGVSVRIGRTNGKPVLHLIRSRNDDIGRTAASVTVPALAAAWAGHDWNTNNTPREATQ